MSEEERKPPILLHIHRALGRILLPLLRFIEPKPVWRIFRALAHATASLFGYNVEDVHAFRIDFTKKKQR